MDAGIADRRQQWQDCHRLEAGRSRAQHDHRTDQADGGRRPAEFSDFLAKEDHREHGDDDGGDEEQRRRIRQRHDRKAEEEEGVGADNQKAAQKMERQLGRPQLAVAAFHRHQYGEADDQRYAGPEGHDLVKRIAAADELDAGVVDRERD